MGFVMEFKKLSNFSRLVWFEVKTYEVFSSDMPCKTYWGVLIPSRVFSRCLARGEKIHLWLTSLRFVKKMDGVLQRCQYKVLQFSNLEFKI